jgi:hypothetical protein
MNKIETTVSLILYGAAATAPASQSMYTEGSRCEMDAIKATCPAQHPDLPHVHEHAKPVTPVYPATTNVTITPATA